MRSLVIIACLAQISFVTLTVLFPSFVQAQATLEDPAADSFQSGIGVIRGWACNANRVDIVFDDSETFQTAYGTSREDTRSVCGKSNTGFGLLYNWNLLGDGTHSVRALADGAEFARVTITVTTLGAEFLRSKAGTFPLPDFPQAGTDLTIRWQESMQNFAIASVSPNAVVSQLATGPVMWIGAHPDDEGVVAPLLGDLCVERGQACTLLVATRGETGPCKLTGGCHPDLASVRTQEIQNAAVLFGAQLVLWNLPDQPGGTPESVLTAWANTVGGEDTLVDQMAAAIAVAAPAVIVTYDPRHGSTCHPAHRAVAALALSAVERLNRRETSAYFNHPGTVVPTVYLVETQIGFSADGSPNSFSLAVPDDARVRTYDATQRLARVNASAWEYLLSDTGVYRSQFSVTDLNTLRAIPLESQRVFLLPLADTSSVLDSRYTELCR